MAIKFILSDYVDCGLAIAQHSPRNFIKAIAFTTPSFHLRTRNVELSIGTFSFGTRNSEFRTGKAELKRSLFSVLLRYAFHKTVYS
ncbi:hypothetical protein [Nostoc sp.]|uniref:hypothetical protein n=1 Tax=Nostoc sp. TaxID=1180 RepID=UPI002FF81A46